MIEIVNGVGVFVIRTLMPPQQQQARQHERSKPEACQATLPSKNKHIKHRISHLQLSLSLLVISNSVLWNSEGNKVCFYQVWLVFHTSRFWSFFSRCAKMHLNQFDLFFFISHKFILELSLKVHTNWEEEGSDGHLVHRNVLFIARVNTSKSSNYSWIQEPHCLKITANVSFYNLASEASYDYI